MSVLKACSLALGALLCGACATTAVVLLLSLPASSVAPDRAGPAGDHPLGGRLPIAIEHPAPGFLQRQPMYQ